MTPPEASPTPVATHDRATRRLHALQERATRAEQRADRVHAHSSEAGRLALVEREARTSIETTVRDRRLAEAERRISELEGRLAEIPEREERLQRRLDAERQLRETMESRLRLTLDAAEADLRQRVHAFEQRIDEQRTGLRHELDRGRREAEQHAATESDARAAFETDIRRRLADVERRGVAATDAVADLTRALSDDLPIVASDTGRSETDAQASDQAADSPQAQDEEAAEAQEVADAEPGERGSPEGSPLNRVTYGQLRRMGLSITQARRFVRQRTRSGGFASVEQMAKATGLPAGLTERLRSELTD
ncbi:MAG: hypothetical protein ACR2NA_11975 [Solirubrobacterales bacterium]